ncbi:hypothetical protein Tco_0926925 [Tanacetum coccineum]|uniref:Uncharacterized protein n=1 Tax=Tanacetum coccineum TaxID=301880 RepID=A0ABQ5DB80_9ASTR
MGSGGRLLHLRGKYSSVFKYGYGEVGGVVKMSSRGARGEGVVMRLFEGSRSGVDSLEGMSIMLVRATFLGGFLVEDEALEAILKVD